MFELVLGVCLVLILYARIFGYKYLIDDAVPMSQYLYNVPQSAPAPNFYLQVAPAWMRCLGIGAHLMNIWLVYLLIGGKAALLFAVFPICVNNVAWITGSYYSCTTMLTLISLYFIVHTPWWIGLLVGTVIYAVALNTTVVTIAFPLVFLFAHHSGLVTLVSLATFLLGKRFTVGKKIREDLATGAKIEPDVFTWRRLVVMAKVVGLYLFLAFWPFKLLFFRKWGARFRIDADERKRLEAVDALFFASLVLIAAFLLFGVVLGRGFWAVWFLVLIGAFSQFRMLGQFFAERYMYPAIVGFVAVMSALPTDIFWVLVGLYIARTHIFIPVFKDCKSLAENGVAQDPEEASNYCNLFDWHYVVEPDFSLAGYYTQKNIALDPEDFKGYSNFASLWRSLGQPLKAREFNAEAKKRALGKASDYIHGIVDRQYFAIEESISEMKVKGNGKK